MSWRIGGEKCVSEIRIIIDTNQSQVIQSITITPGLYQDCKIKGITNEMIFDLTEKIRIDLVKHLDEILFCKV